MGEAAVFEPRSDYVRGHQRAIVSKVCASWAMLVGPVGAPVWEYRVHWEPDVQTGCPIWWVFAREGDAHGAAMRWQGRV